ncbi:MAG: hypothetical protein AAF533_18055 [Acidobacteriota bacterium]
MRHFLLMTLWAACVSGFFASLLREDWRSALKFFGTLFGIMVVGAYVAGWVMYWIGS